MEEKKIAIYYIATGLYKKFFPGFISTLHNFFPGIRKIVVLLSDEMMEYHDSDEIRVRYVHVDHYPWPILTLYKMWHILRNLQDDCDYHCYFNANSEIHPNNPDMWFDPDKLTVSYHGASLPPRFLFPKINISKESCAYLPNYSYEYVQGGFFMGNTLIIKEMCEACVEMVNDDASRHIYAQWHDESYLNKWCVNKAKVNRKFIMTVFDYFISEMTFVKLRNKDEIIPKEFKNI